MKNRMNKGSSDPLGQDARALYFTDRVTADEVARIYASPQSVARRIAMNHPAFVSGAMGADDGNGLRS